LAEPAETIDIALPRSGRFGTASSRWEEPSGTLRQARGRRVARELVELSRLQGGAERAEFSELDLAAFLRTICVDYPAVELRGPAQLPMTTDSRRLARVLFTLLDNAYLHGVPPVTVTFDASEITVEDCGRGFAARVLEHVAQPFITGERSRGRGIGLGIAIAARHASLLGASLELSNSPKGGAIARLRLERPTLALASA
jgi:signal transduction histidine kinase